MKKWGKEANKRYWFVYVMFEEVGVNDTYGSIHKEDELKNTKTGNYFRTRREAQQVASKIRQLLKHLQK